MQLPIVDSYEEIFRNKQRVMTVFAHPDDLELYSGGTIARLIADGKTVRSVKITNGDMGSRQENISSDELGSLREKEDRESMNQLGIREENNIYLKVKDGAVENSMELIGIVAEQIRIFKPDLIITHNPENIVIRFDKNVNWINHRDHRNTALTTIDAAYPYSRDVLFFPEHFKNSQASSHSTSEFLLVDYYDHPDLVGIEVTAFIDIRVKAHACHSSQYSLKNAQESADFFTSNPNYQGKRYERFRYVLAD